MAFAGMKRAASIVLGLSNRWAISLHADSKASPITFKTSLEALRD